MGLKIEERLNGYIFTWEEERIKIEVSRLKVRPDGVFGEIFIKTSAPGFHPLLHPPSQINFASSKTYNSLLKGLKSEHPDFDWNNILGQLFCYILEYTRRGEPVEIISTEEEIEPLEYYLKPIILKGHPTIIFGEGAVGKSKLALIFSVCLQLPWYDNPLELEVPQQPVNILYLDYETDKATFKYDLKRIQKGMGLPFLEINYRRCAFPLAEDLEQLSNHIVDRKIELIIIDSLGNACGGNLNEAETALNFFSALRQLKVTSLLLAHTSKEQEKSKTIFGSAYFSFSARSIFELKKVQETGEDELHLGLFHRKSNFTKLFPPIGFHLKFTEDTIVAEREDVRTIDEFIKELSLSSQISQTLKRGAMTVKELAELLEAPPNSIQVTLNKMLKKGKVVKLPQHKWGLNINGLLTS